MTFGEKVQRLVAVPGGVVRVSDFYPNPSEGRTPYRYATLTVRAAHADAPAQAAILAALTVEIGGHLSVHVFTDECDLDISLSRELTPDELRTSGPHSLDVSIEEAVRS